MFKKLVSISYTDFLLLLLLYTNELDSLFAQATMHLKLMNVDVFPYRFFVLVLCSVNENTISMRILKQLSIAI